MLQVIEKPVPEVPFGFCQCGCGQATTPAPQTYAARGLVRGQPQRYVAGHGQRANRPAALRWIEDASGCWLWQGAVSDGYGKTYFRGVGENAHRVVYEHLIGPIPAGKMLDHTCHNEDSDCVGGSACLHRRCVNPDHLEPATGLENSRRGRRSKLTVELASGIRERARTMPLAELALLAAEYEVSPYTIVSILLGKTWVETPDQEIG